jgi:glycosyltransferase involved in cell wall biosynthesis
MLHKSDRQGSSRRYRSRIVNSPTIHHLAVCLPARDEAESLRALLPELDRSLANLGVKQVSVYVFDDGSRDATAEVVGSTRLLNGQLFLIQSRAPTGKAFGLRLCLEAGLESGADAIVMMDADGQDDPAFLVDMLGALRSGFDVVNGRRRNRAHSIRKRVSSRAFNAAVRLSTGYEIWDINSGFKGFSPRAARVLAPYLYGELHRVLIVIAIWLGLSVGEVLVRNRDRFAGQTKYGAARGWRGLFDLASVHFILRYQNRPSHFFGGVGGSTMLLGFVAGGLGLLAVLPETYVVTGVVLAGLGFSLVGFGFLADLILFLSKAPASHVTTRTPVEPLAPNP